MDESRQKAHDEENNGLSCRIKGAFASTLQLFVTFSHTIRPWQACRPVGMSFASGNVFFVFSNSRTWISNLLVLCATSLSC